MKQMIQQAFLQLLSSAPMHEIAVKNITDQANIHRSTFYVYYSNKEALYQAIIEDTLFDLEKAIQPASNLTFEAIQKLYEESTCILNEALFFLQHIESNELAYRVLLSDIQFQKQFADVIQQSIMLGNILPTIQAKHLSYGAIGLIQEWLQNKAHYTIQELALYLTRSNIHALIDYSHTATQQQTR